MAAVAAAVVASQPAARNDVTHTLSYCHLPGYGPTRTYPSLPALASSSLLFSLSADSDPKLSLQQKQELLAGVLSESHRELKLSKLIHLIFTSTDPELIIQ